MPKKNFKNIGTLQGYEYVAGVIDSIDGGNDTCGLTVGEDTFEGVPIFYHCHPEAEERDNGALEGAAGAFAVGDDVIVLKQRKPDKIGDTQIDDVLKLFVIGHVGEKRHCAGNMILIVAAKSGAEAFAYDLINETVLVTVDSYDNVVSQLHGMGFNGEPEKLEPSFTTNPYLTLEKDASIVDERTSIVYETPTLWMAGDSGFRGRQLVPCSVISVGDVSSITGSAWQGQQDYVDTIYADVPYIQNPYAEELEAHLVYDYIDNSIYRGNTLTGYPLLQYMNHSVFDNRFPTDADLPADDNDAKFFLYTRWQFYGTGLYFYNPDMGEMDAEFVEVIREPGQTVDFQTAQCGVAANPAGAVIVEDVLYYIDLPDAGVVETTFRNIRLFAREMQPATSGIEEKALQLINHERTQRDLVPYAWNHVLARACVRHSEDMAEHEFYSHTGSDASEPDDRVEDSGWRTHPTVGMITNDEHPEVVGEGGNPGATEVLGNWHTENVAKVIPGVDPLESPPHNIDTGVYEQVISQPEYEAMGIAEITVALWMASLDGHREALLDEDCNGNVPEEKAESGEYGANEMAISAVQGGDGAWYWTFLAGRKFWHWAGFGCVDTDPIKDYVALNFAFEDALQFEENEGWWFIPGANDRGNVTEPHWFLKPLNHRSDFGFGQAPEMPVKKELEYYLI